MGKKRVRESGSAGAGPAAASGGKTRVALELGDAEGVYLAGFPSATLQGAGAAVSSEAAVPTQLRAFASSHKKRKRQRLLLASTAHVSLTAKHHPMTDDRETRYMVGVLDPATGTLTLRRARTFHMTPAIRGEELLLPDLTAGIGGRGTAAAAAASPAHIERTPAEKRAMVRASLVESFGGKRRKAQMASDARGRVDSSMLDAGWESVQHKLDTSSVGQHTGADAEPQRPIPGFVADAATPHEAYPLDSLLPPTERASLKVLAKPLTRTGAKNRAELQHSGLYQQPILDVQATFDNDDPKTRAKKAACLVLASFLFQLRTLCKGRGIPDFKLEESLQDCPGDVTARILKQFTELVEPEHSAVQAAAAEGKTAPMRRKTTAWKSDLLVSNILVWLMWAQDFAPLRLGPIAQELSIKQTKMQQHFRELGCGFATVKIAATENEPATTDKVATLKLPLKFPQIRRGRK